MSGQNTTPLGLPLSREKGFRLSNKQIYLYKFNLKTITAQGGPWIMNNEQKEFFIRFFRDFFKKILPVWVIIAVVITVAVLLVWRALTSIYEDLTWEGYYAYWIMIFYFIVYAVSLTKFAVEVDQNECLNYEDSRDGSIHPKWPGFNWVGFYERVWKSDRFEVNTQKHNTTEELGDWDTGGQNANAQNTGEQLNDTLVGKWKTLWRVDVKDSKTRDKNMRKFCLVTDSNIESAMKLTAEIAMTVYCQTRDAEKAKAEKSQALPKSTYYEPGGVCSSYGIEILDSGAGDLDYSKEVRDARKSSSEMRPFRKAFQDSVNELMKSPTNPHGCTDPVEAQKIVKAKMLAGNYKQIDISNTTGTPVVINP